MAMVDCAAFTSCGTCTAPMGSGVDSGVRCVWCPSLDVCKPYQRYSFDFPCVDALRPGGGYPGGDSCDNIDNTMRKEQILYAAKSLAKVRVNTRDKLDWKYPPYEHTPTHTQVAVSVVIPSFGRPTNVPHALVHLLGLEPMRRTGSEIIISHGSERSFKLASAIDANATALLRQLPGGGEALTERGKIRHVDATEWNKKYYVAQRFVATAGLVRNDVVVHVDDDLIPTEQMLSALIDGTLYAIA